MARHCFDSLVQQSRGALRMDEDGQPMAMETSVNILNHQRDGMIYFDAFSPLGFRLNTGLRVYGPVAAFPKTLLHWNVSRFKG